MKSWAAKLLGDLRGDFWRTLARWQDGRAIWLLGGGAALGLEIFSWAYFQKFLGLRPCELCVYIRFSMVVIFVGAAVAAVRPANWFFKLIGYGVCFWGMGKGLAWDLTLGADYVKAVTEPWSVLCSDTTAHYPFGLPLAEWLPGHFAPTASCGEDGWSMWGWNMAQWLYLVYGTFLIGLATLLLSWIISLFRRRT